MDKPVAVVLSGCGVFDGSEIHESVCVLLALDRADVAYQCVAPNVSQAQVINHLSQQPVTEVRNALHEAARIARGDIKDIATVSAEDFSAAIYPGGFGAASTLSTFVEDGAGCEVQPDVLKFAQAMAGLGKPQGFICIAPAMISKIYGPDIQQTIGNDHDTAAMIGAMGGQHVDCGVRDVIIDERANVVSTPAYMLAERISEVADGVSELVTQVLDRISYAEGGALA